MRPTHTAYHEAGHAVANIVLGGEVQFATIVPSKSAAGRVRSTSAVTNDIYDRYRIKAVELHAGPEAQRRWHPDTDIVAGSETDRATLDLIVIVLFGEESSPFIGRCFLESTAFEAARLIERHRAAVDGVAHALMAQRTLDGPAIRAIVENAEKPAVARAGHPPTRPPIDDPAWSTNPAVAASRARMRAKSRLAGLPFA